MLNRSKFKAWIVGGVALVSLAAGWMVTARLMHLKQVKADSNRVFELMVYHTTPGKVPALESIFRDVSKLQAKHEAKTNTMTIALESTARANRKEKILEQ